MDFLKSFRCLNGSDDIDPFPWQERLYHDFCEGRIPRAIDIPTGLGKTKVIHIWLLALAANNQIPRRLVYVVNRRAVVDQASSEAESVEKQLAQLPFSDTPLFPDGIAISKLRGQHVDTGDWRMSPARPGIIVGTVDMIGSRLLFEGYGVSRRMRPLHAGILGVDTLLVLDEAHLVPAFESLVDSLAHKLDLKGTEPLPRPRLKLLALSATHLNSKSDGVFCLSDKDHRDSEIMRRINAKKSLRICPVISSKSKVTKTELADKMAGEACKIANQDNQKIVIYCDSREVAEKVETDIRRELRSTPQSHDGKVILFTGARRIHERSIAEEELRSHGFLAGGVPQKSVFLVATSAGEVGVDLDADHAVMDLVAWERMVQRLGRVNRRGNGDAKIIVCDAREETSPSGVDLNAVRELLKNLPEGFQAGPDALSKVSVAEPDLVLKATTPAPLIPPLTKPLIESWSMTELREHTGRPEVHPWLYGWSENERPQTRVVWRSHLPRRENDEVDADEIENFFRHAKPHIRESLETESKRAKEWLYTRTNKIKNEYVSEKEVVAYILTTRNTLKKKLTIREITKLAKPVKNMTPAEKKEEKIFEDSLIGAILIVDANLGGLSPEGLLNKDEDDSVSTPDKVEDEENWADIDFRIRLKSRDGGQDNEPDSFEAYKFVRKITSEGAPLEWLSVILKSPKEGEDEASSLSSGPVSLADHAADVEQEARKIAGALGLPQKYIDLLALAGRLHDEGKRHERWQKAMRAPLGGGPYAKTLRGNGRMLAGYRHEFGSLLIAKDHPCIKAISDEADRDLLLHLITAHHGNARPGISVRGCDMRPPSSLETEGLEVALRYARLQNKWGVWGLAWWEALLRSADQIASKKEAENG